MMECGFGRSLLSSSALQFGAMKPSRLVRKISSIFRIYWLKIHGNINFWHTHTVQFVRRNVINLDNLVLKIIKMHYEYTGISIVGLW
jgi:hypothetical protein